MFSKVALSTLAVGALSANALAVPVARSPAPQPESWSEWGKNIGNYYANQYKSPSAVPGLPQFKREPGVWAQLDHILGDPEAGSSKTYKRQLEDLVDSRKHHLQSSQGDPPDTDDSHFFRREPGMWAQLDHILDNPKAGSSKTYKRQLEDLVDSRKHHTHTSHDDPPTDPDADDSHFFKREPGLSAWLKGLIKAGSSKTYKREPGLWAQLDHVINDPKSGSSKTYKRQLETLVDLAHHIKSDSDLDYDQGSHHDSKREPFPEPETWEEWGTNIGNHYANKYGTPSQVPGLPRPRLNSRHEHHDHASPSSAPGDHHPGKDDHHHHHKGDHHHGHKSSKPEPSKTTTPTSTPSPKS